MNIFEAHGKDDLFNAIKNEGSSLRSEAKVFTQKLWEETHYYLDTLLANELSQQFHGRFWEMYLVAALLDIEKELEKGRSGGPDICIKSTADLPKIWIEAVTAQPGDGPNAVQEVKPKVVRGVPDTQINLRLLNAFDAKFTQFKNHKKNNLICNNEPYIIAINTAQIPLASLDDNDVPRIVESLLAFGDLIITIDRQTLKVINSGYSYQDNVPKTSENKIIEIPKTAFLNPEYSGISAVIYSNVDVFNFPEKLSCALLLFHNPLASNPLPLGFLRHGYEYWVDNDELKRKNWN